MSFEQLIASLDSASPRGLRDRAIILCMARLGLRAGEVVQLRLDDLDWVNATVRVCARKTGHGALVPLPDDVGAALAEYLQQARPDAAGREVFVLHRLRVGASISGSIAGCPDRVGVQPGLGNIDSVGGPAQSGARVSELTGLQVRDVLVDRQSAVHLHGKGRKQRAIPLWKNTAAELRDWLGKIDAAPDAPVFPNRAGTPMTRSGVRDRLDRAVSIAARDCPSLRGQHVTPHTLRRSTVMHLLQSGTDLAVIALWLGHSSPAVTHQYLEADLAAKQAVLERLTDPTSTPKRFQPADQLVAFLQSL